MYWFAEKRKPYISLYSLDESEVYIWVHAHTIYHSYASYLLSVIFIYYSSTLPPSKCYVAYLLYAIFVYYSSTLPPNTCYVAYLLYAIFVYYRSTLPPIKCYVYENVCHINQIKSLLQYALQTLVWTMSNFQHSRMDWFYWANNT